MVTEVSSSPATTWALVTTMPGAATQPEPSTPRPQAVPSTRTTEAPARRTSGSVALARVGAAERRRRADDRGRRVDPVERVEDRARRAAGRWLRLRRISERWTSSRRLAVPGRVQGDGAEDPDHAEGDAGDEGGAAGAVGEVQAAIADHPGRAARGAMLSSVTATSAPPTRAPSAASSGA